MSANNNNYQDNSKIPVNIKPQTIFVKSAQDYNLENNINQNQNENYINYNYNINQNNNPNQNFDFNKLSDPEKTIRLGFIRKVYGILSIQLLITFAFVSITFIKKVRKYLSENFLLFYICLVLSIILCIILICVKKIAKKFPINYILLIIWTICESYLLATASSYYNYKLVISAIGITIGLFIGITIYAIKSKTNFTYCGGFLFCFLGISLFFMLFGFIFGKWGNIIFCALGVFIYSFYLLYDTQLIFKRFGIGYSIDDYIIAALNIYIDFIEILINVLSLLGSSNNN